MPEPTLDWSTAEVKDSKLTVQVEGDLPEGWEDTFTSTAKLLGGGSWGEVKLEEQKAEVSGVTPGSEEKLKHFLESVVLQANSTHESDEEDEEEREEQDREDEDEDEEERESDSDKEMSERFRSFADDGDSSDEESDEDSSDEDSSDEESDDDDSSGKKSKSQKSKSGKSKSQKSEA
jgi:translation initiation factor 5B